MKALKLSPFIQNTIFNSQNNRYSFLRSPPRTLLYFSLSDRLISFSLSATTHLCLSFSLTPISFSLTFSHFLSQIFPRICPRHELHSCSSHSIAHSVPIPYLFRSMRFIWTWLSRAELSEFWIWKTVPYRTEFAPPSWLMEAPMFGAARTLILLRLIISSSWWMEFSAGLARILAFIFV